MKVLGIDTSCDDTAVAVYDSNENRVLSNVVSTQYEAHKPFGGVVPEIAAREHLKNIDFVFDEALKKADVTVDDIDLVAVTYTPGLLPALLVGLTFGKGIAYGKYIPFKGVHHIEGHIFSPFIGREIRYPFLSLVVSGGHTMLTVVNKLGRYNIIGKTVDDAIGEAFDKVAKMLGLGYPGGPIIDKIFREYDGDYIDLPKPQVKGVGMSFSGLKTAVRRLVDKGYPSDAVAASFQKTAIDYVFGKLKKAIRETGIKRVSVAGGVAANSYLRERLLELTDEGVEVFLPEIQYTSDNGAMIAFVGYLRFCDNDFVGDSFELNALPNLSIERI